MSYDLMVFELSEAPKTKAEFMSWFSEQTSWSEPHSYNDHAVTSPALKAWFEEMIKHFPPMNGPLASVEGDSPKVTDHCIGKHLIYSAFSWSEAEEAHEKMRSLAIKHRVGFFDVSADNGEILYHSKKTSVGVKQQNPHETFLKELPAFLEQRNWKRQDKPRDALWRFSTGNAYCEIYPSRAIKLNGGIKIKLLPSFGRLDTDKLSTTIYSEETRTKWVRDTKPDLATVGIELHHTLPHHEPFWTAITEIFSLLESKCDSIDFEEIIKRGSEELLYLSIINNRPLSKETQGACSFQTHVTALAFLGDADTLLEYEGLARTGTHFEISRSIDSAKATDSAGTVKALSNAILEAYERQ